MGLVDFYEKKANVSIIRSQCQTYLATMKLTRNYSGGPLKFFQQFQSTYLDLETATNTVVSDEEKIGQLNAALYDERFQNI